MTKEERHKKAELFREQISRPAHRREAILGLISKKTYDESDILRLKILFNKVSLAEGCDGEYKKLIVRLYQEDPLRPMAEDFFKRWNAK